MKNLKVIPKHLPNIESGLVCSCINPDDDTIFVLDHHWQLQRLSASSPKADSKTKLNIASSDPTSTQPTSLTFDDIKLFEFVVEAVSLFLGLRNGSIFIIDTDSFSIRLIHQHNTNISSLRLSQSQDILALADQEHNIELFSTSTASSRLTKLYHSNALKDDKSLHQPVGVGWGSKETQFFGLDGRPSKESSKETDVILTDDELSIINTLMNNQEYTNSRMSFHSKTVIDWRGDGQYIASLTHNADTNKHQLKIWNRRLELQYKSEQLVDIESGLLSYVPNGNFVCCAQRRSMSINEVILFEKNGLVHQRIDLPRSIKNLCIENISWSPDSKILAIVARQYFFSDGEVSYQCLLFMLTMQNWHYYLKFSTPLPAALKYFVSWHPNTTGSLLVMSERGHAIIFDSYFCVDYSKSAVVVVDADKLLITDMEYCIIPPPFSAIEIQTLKPIYKFAIEYTDPRNIFVITLEGKLICTSSKFPRIGCDKPDFIIKTNDHSAPESALRLAKHFEHFRKFQLDDFQSFQHFIPLVDSLELIASKAIIGGSEIVLIKYGSESLEYKLIANIAEKQVTCLSRNVAQGIIHVSLNDGTSAELNLTTHQLVPVSQQVIQTTQYIIESNLIDTPQKPILVSLSRDSYLIVDLRIIAFNTCTSFRITSNFIVYTHSDNTIHFILISKLCNQTKLSSASWSQSIEAGGTIIIVDEDRSKVVLQMPRGNLETLHPRILILNSLISLLREKSYEEACKLARRHRVNTNFLVDYILHLCGDSKEFTDTLYKKDRKLLSLIITELEDCDTLSRYHRILDHALTGLPESKYPIDVKENKIKFVCSRIETKWLQHGQPVDLSLLNLEIQRLVKMSPSDVGEAICCIRNLPEAEEKAEAIKFLLYFVDIDQLFRDALGTYDRDIALMVANASNKDPKEYLALLSEIKNEPEITLERYKIDMFCKRYERAASNLILHMIEKGITDKARAQFIDLVSSKRIYSCVLRILNDHELKELKEIEALVWSKYGLYLLEKRYYNEAGLAFSKAHINSSNISYLESALKSFSLTNDYRQSMALVARSPVELELKQAYLQKIQDRLIDKGYFNEAILVKSYGTTKMSESLPSILISRGCWYLVEFFDSDPRWRIEISKSVHDTAASLSDTFKEELSEAKVRLGRLLTLLNPSKVQPSQSQQNYPIDSLSTTDGSEISSISSEATLNKPAKSGAASIITRKSSKGTNIDRKRISLKLGSKYEDLALILELKKFIAKQKDEAQQALVISAALFEYCPLETAKELSRSFRSNLSENLEFSRSCTEQLWPSPGYDQTYSLYKRLGDYYNYNEGHENIDFEILIKPNVPSEVISYMI